MVTATNFDPKKHTRSSLGLSPSKAGPSGKATIKKEQDTSENLNILFKAERLYAALYSLRKAADRFNRYANGDQWGDYMRDDYGQTITEEDNIRAQGKVPLVNNRIGNILDAVIGQWLQNPSKSMVISRTREKQASADMLSNALEACLDANQVDLVDKELLRRYLIEKVMISQVGFDYNHERDIEDGTLDIVPLERAFFDADIEDIRPTKDLQFMGHFFDITINKAVSMFAKNKQDEAIIREVLKPEAIDEVYERLERDFFKSFYDTPGNNKVRIYLVWYKTSEWRVRYHDPVEGIYDTETYSVAFMNKLLAENELRIQKYTEAGIPEDEWALIDIKEKNEEYWVYKYMTNTGFVLREGETPYEHGSHPYAITISKRGLVESVIDQQRYINRLITLIDFIISASAKGVLMVPETVIGDMSPDEFALEWKKFNGVITYKPDEKNPNAVPKQISANSTNVGAFELLNLQLSLLQQISGVSGAMQGQEAKSGTPASLYAQEAQNSSTNLIHIFHDFMRFKEVRDMKLLKTLVQYYDKERYISVAGVLDDEAMYYKPEEAKNIQFDLRVAEGTSTPVFRQLQEEKLWELFMAKAVTIEQYLSNSSLPYSDKLLDQINKAKETNNPQDIATPEMNQFVNDMQQEQNRVNPKAMDLINSFLRDEAA